MSASQSPLKRLAGAAPSRVGVYKAGPTPAAAADCQIRALAGVGIEETINEDAYEAWVESKMATVKFESQDQFEKVFDCRYELHRPCPHPEACPFGVSRDACEEGWFYGMEGRPACGTRIEIGDDYAVETRERPEGGADVVEEQI